MEEKQNSESNSRIKINPPVFIGSTILVFVFVIFTMIYPEKTGEIFSMIQGWIIDTAGWFYILAVATYLVAVVMIAGSAYGKIKLGPDHSEPDYSYASWIAMLFSAGMGIGLMFFGVAEPIMHFNAPPAAEGGTIEAAREAMKLTFFHWGLHAWAIYAVVALALAYFAFRHNLPLTLRSSLYPIIGDRIYGPIGHAVDIFAVLGTIFGVATSLGLGVMQINSGIEYLFGIPNTVFVQISLIAIITLFATISVVMGLDGGIKRISELNLALAALLVLFVLIAGPTLFIFQTFVQNTGAYISDIVNKTFNLYAYDPTGWIGGWTLFYWGWWIAWSPFVGMFIARISRGRTIREFVTGVLLIPVGFTFIWFTVFGNSAIFFVLIEGYTGLIDAVSADTSVALFQFFEHLPFSWVASMLATILVITFFVTSSDSGSLVIDIITSGGDQDPPVWQRIYWALSEGVVAAALLLAGGLVALQTASIASALPFSVVLLFVLWGLVRSLRVEVVKRQSIQNAIVMPKSFKSPVKWQNRLKTIIHQPRQEEVLNFIQQTVKPALKEVSEELKHNNLKVRVEDGEDGRVWLEVYHGEESDFFYSVRPVPHTPPAFALSETRSQRKKKMTYYRAEVHLLEGGQDYDIMGWNKEQIISNLLDQYEKHMHFLNQVR